jgi:plastocyanin
LAALPAVASSEPQTVEAVNEGLYYHSWKPAAVTVIAGDAVAFRNNTEVPHGIEWRSAVKPVCTSGVPVGTGAEASGTNWSGTCTFSQAGTYTFYCTVHGPEMTGTVTVNANGTTTVTATPPPPPGPTTPSPSPSPSGEGSPLNGSPAKAVKLAKSQRGGVVRGSLSLSSAAAGRRLEVDLLAKRLRGARHSGSTRVGRLLRGSLSSGVTTFAVRLDAAARRVLKRKGRLALSVKIAIGPGAGGKQLVVTRAVEVHA